jgi:citronellol/citronellal dehydrogenase
MRSLQDKVVLITGASRGIGKAIALKLAREGANIVITGKTETPHSTLPGTIHETAAEIEAEGSIALPLMLDVRFEDKIANVVKKTQEKFGRIDALINNASAITLTDTANTPMKKYDLMHSINARGTFAMIQACLPLLKKAENPHVLTLSPPLSMDPKWFRNHCAYTMSKYAMSMCVLGMSEEFREQGIAVNALWPRTLINTAALNMLPALVPKERSRKPDIVADAVSYVLKEDSCTYTGNFLIDEDVLRAKGVSDFAPYALDASQNPFPDLFVD